MTALTGKKLKVAFLHPDLGLGGAERLVVDAAVGLQSRGHTVTMYTSHHDPGHCFSETRDGTLDVRVYGDWLPRHCLGRLHILFAVLRMLWLTACIAFRRWWHRWVLRSGEMDYDVLFVDQLSASVPLLRVAVAPVFFYGHFPDLKLATRGSVARSAYRAPFDLLESLTTRASNAIAANSAFTARTFAEALSIDPPMVLHPGINFSHYASGPFREDKGKTPAQIDVVDVDGETNGGNDKGKGKANGNGNGNGGGGIVGSGAAVGVPPALEREVLFLSINRFERKKNLALAMKGFAEMLKLVGHSVAGRCRLVLAGGHDPRVRENVEHLEELRQLAVDLGVASSVYFVPSFTEKQRDELLRRCRCVVYTPENEHFGLVPIEAMYSRRPVIACDSGGPLETVVRGSTGFLCRPEPIEFSRAMATVADWEPSEVREWGERAHTHARAHFSLEAFSARLERMLYAACDGGDAEGSSAGDAREQKEQEAGAGDARAAAASAPARPRSRSSSRPRARTAKRRGKKN